MIAEIMTSAGWLETWGQRMFTASIQGGLLLVLAWIICRFGNRLSASTRCWIWRIAFLKFGVVLICGGLLHLPILPSWDHSAGVSKGDGLARTVLAANERPSTGATRLGSSEPSQTIVLESDSPGWSALADRQPAILSLVFLAWSVGFLWSLINVLRHHVQVNRLIAASEPLQDVSFERTYRVLCSKLKLSKPPTLATTKLLHSPILTGTNRPVILIPKSVIATCGADELRMIVAHELAHAKRRDLNWNWLPVLVRSCFFFHPVVWLAQSRFALDQEIACDQLALSLTRADCGNYASVLVKVSSNTSSPRPPSLATLGVASSFKSLKSRIIEMDQFKNATSNVSQLLSFSAVALSLLLLAPIDLVGQQENDGQQTATAKTSEQAESFASPLGRSQQGAANSVTSSSSETSASSSQGSQSENVSVSISNNGRTESIKVNKNPNGKVVVKYSTAVDGQTQIREYTLDDIEQLAKKNAEAYAFYQKHVSSKPGSVLGSGTRAGSGTRVWSGSGTSGFGSNLPTGAQAQGSNFATGRNSASASSSKRSFSSSSQRASSMGRNGSTRQSQSSRASGYGPNGMGVGNTNRQMTEQINQMIQQTDNPQMKASLKQLLQNMKND